MTRQSGGASRPLPPQDCRDRLAMISGIKITTSKLPLHGRYGSAIAPGAGDGGHRLTHRHRRGDDRSPRPRPLRPRARRFRSRPRPRRADQGLGPASQAHVRLLVLGRPDVGALPRPADGEASAAAGRRPPFRSLARIVRRDGVRDVPGECGRAFHRTGATDRRKPGARRRRTERRSPRQGRALSHRPAGGRRRRACWRPGFILRISARRNRRASREDRKAPRPRR